LRGASLLERKLNPRVIGEGTRLVRIIYFFEKESTQKNNFVERSKILAEIILLNYQNNYVERSN